MGNALNAKGQRKRYIGSTIFSIRATPQERYDAHIQGVLLALSEHDWHAVADHAMDVRELIAAHPELRRHEEKVWSRRKY